MNIINILSVSFRSCLDQVKVLFSEIVIVDFLHVCLVLFGCEVKRPNKFLLALRVFLQTEKKIDNNVVKKLNSGEVEESDSE